MAGSKYHINPKTGRPNKCTATVRGCAYAKDGMVPEHYDTKEEAQKAYEEQNKANTFRSLKKPSKDVNKTAGDVEVKRISELKARNEELKKENLELDQLMNTTDEEQYRSYHEDYTVNLRQIDRNNEELEKLEAQSIETSSVAKSNIKMGSRMKKGLPAVESNPTPGKSHYPEINDDGFIELQKVAEVDGNTMYKLSEDGWLKASLPSGMEIDKINAEEYDYAVEQFTNRFERPAVSDGWYISRSYSYGPGIGEIRSYNSENYGVKFDEGQYYHPTPNEPYHGSDISYTDTPSFEVEDMKLFTEMALSGYEEDTGVRVVYTKELRDDLNDNGFYDGYNYDAVIGGQYYGDEFEGFAVNGKKAEKWGKILALHSIAQLNNPDKVKEYQE